ncbi:hypothetical protein V499_00656 [Pseudogymnoascus sp. VKM F-103]|nr:hypothetical protein V499_00656 [Pseudogymnoascus sp. VKM F-103]
MSAWGCAIDDLIMVTDADLKLQIFGDKSMTIEDIIREQGQLVKKGTLSEDGDFEIWADGTVTDRPKPTGEGEGAKVQEVAAPTEKL